MLIGTNNHISLFLGALAMAETLAGEFNPRFGLPNVQRTAIVVSSAKNLRCVCPDRVVAQDQSEMKDGKIIRLP